MPTIKDSTNYLGSRYGAYAAPWGKKELKPEVDFADRIVIDDAAFPHGTAIKWHWPIKADSRVFGYHHIWTGNYNGTSPKEKINPEQIKNMGRWLLEYDLSLDLIAGDANVLTEGFLCRKPGDTASKEGEVGLFPYISEGGRKFAETGVKLGTFDGWTVWQHGSFYMFVPAASALKGALSIRDAIHWLVAQGKVDPTLYLQGWAMGVEPISGSGILRVNRFSVTP